VAVVVGFFFLFIYLITQYLKDVYVFIYLSVFLFFKNKTRSNPMMLDTKREIRRW